MRLERADQVCVGGQFGEVDKIAAIILRHHANHLTFLIEAKIEGREIVRRLRSRRTRPSTT